MFAQVEMVVTLDPKLSDAIAADRVAGRTMLDLKHVLDDIYHVMVAAALRGDAFAEEHIGDILRQFR